MADRDMAAMRQAGNMWWMFLLTGIAWLAISLIVLQFDAKSVATVGVVVGIVLLLGGFNEFATMSMKTEWKWAHGLMGVLFIVGGIWALMHPFSAFATLASVLGFILIFKGTLDIVVAVMSKDQNELWWLGLLVGIFEVLLAFWVSAGPEYLGQNFEKRAVLIILWVGMMALFRGIGEIAMAFTLHRVKKEMAAA